jgi:hypothetical protein
MEEMERVCLVETGEGGGGDLEEGEEEEKGGGHVNGSELK